VGIFELKVISIEGACYRCQLLANSLPRKRVVDMYCSKNLQQRTRESMRNQRLKNRTDELLQIIEDEVNDDSSMDTTNATNQAVTDPDDVVSCECTTQFSADGSSDGSSDDSSSSATHHDHHDEFVESDSFDEDVDDFLFNYDLNNQTKLFPSCPLSITSACRAILKLTRRLNLDKSGMKHLLDFVRSICPINVKLPRTINGLMKIIGE
jgi:hypothetical protein